MTDFTHRIKITAAEDDAGVAVEPLALDRTLHLNALDGWCGRSDALDEIYESGAKCVAGERAELAEMSDVTIACILVMVRCEVHPFTPDLVLVDVELTEPVTEAA